MSKHNTADVFSKQPNYANEVEEDSCLSMLQSKLKAMRTVTPESFKPSKGKPNKTDHARHISNVFTLMRYKPTIRDESEMNWHKLPESSMRKLNEINHTEHIGDVTTLMECKLAI